MRRAKFLTRAPLAVFEPIRFDDTDDVLCHHCQEFLDRHQPDPEQPGHLLGTCTCCKAWFLIDEQAGVMYALPDLWTIPPRATG